MTRGIYTRWVIGSIALLIIVAGACYLWYQHETAPGRKAVAESAEELRRWETTQKADTDNVPEGETNIPVERTMPTAEKSITETSDKVVKNEGPTQAQNDMDFPAEIAEKTQTAETADISVSPYGFGPYPKVPEDYPTKHLVKWPRPSAKAELLSRVLIKLWTDGEKNFYGGSTHDGKIYPHYYNTVYVHFVEYRLSDGEKVRYPAIIKSGPHVEFRTSELFNPPSHLRVLDLNSSGINPYQYLDLSYKKGVK